MLHYETIHPTTLELLKKLANMEELQGMRLVGGTSLALQYGHRQSVDLDFFGKLSVPQEEIIEMARKLGDFKLYNRTKYILQFILDNVKIDVVDYANYEWIDEPIVENENQPLDGKLYMIRC